MPLSINHDIGKLDIIIAIILSILFCLPFIFEINLISICGFNKLCQIQEQKINKHLFCHLVNHINNILVYLYNVYSFMLHIFVMYQILIWIFSPALFLFYIFYEVK